MNNKVEIGNPKLSYLFDEEVVEKDTSLYDAVEMVALKTGMKVEATLVGENETEFLFDANAKDYIRVDRNRHEEIFITESEQEIFELRVLKVFNNPYLIKGSVASLYRERVHDDLRDLKDTQFVEAKVNEMTNAGYNMTIYYNSVELRAFMPHTLAGINKLNESARDGLVGRKIDVMIESYSEKGTYIVSRKKYLESLIPDAIADLNKETIYTGNVTGTTPFGVFVEFKGCLTGMIYKSNISAEWQDKISEIKPGMEIEFYVKDVFKNKIFLTQILKDYLWDSIEVDQIFDAKVFAVKETGTLVNLDEETIAMIPRNELIKGNKSFEVGDIVPVAVDNLNKEQRKIFLSLDVG